MSDLRAACERYIHLRRQLGYQLRGPAHLLRSFVAFAEREQATHVTTDVAARWAQQPTGVLPATWATRLRVVRQFAVWLSASDRRTQVPPADLLSGSYRRPRPYIYTDAEVERLVGAAGRVPSATGWTGLTLSTLVGLLAASGLRVGEALALDRGDVDLADATLRVRQTKFGKPRLVPLHDSACRALAGYADRRDRTVPRPATAAFFVGETGGRATGAGVRYHFRNVSRDIGLRPAGVRTRPGPRLHDLRHRFVVHTLLRWYRAGVDVEREMPKLTAYLGHVHVNVTYWYIEAVPELLDLAARRWDRAPEGQP